MKRLTPPRIVLAEGPDSRRPPAKAISHPRNHSTILADTPLPDWFNDQRSPDERRLHRLREWLGRHSWNEYEAKMVLRRFLLPDKYAVCECDPLPGAESWKGMSEFEIREFLSDLVEHLGGS